MKGLSVFFSLVVVAAKKHENRTPCHLRTGHNKADQSDFRNQQFEPDTGKMWKMRKVSFTPETTRSEEIPQLKNAENVEMRMRKVRLIGFNLPGFR